MLYKFITAADTENAIRQMKDLVAGDYVAAQSGSFLATMRQSWRNVAGIYFVESSWYMTPRFFALLFTTALIGLLLGRWRFFQDLQSKLPLIAPHAADELSAADGDLHEYLHGVGLGLFGKVGPALGMLLAVTIFFAIQVPFSRWWLGRFQVGPMEYLWRMLSYGRRESVGRLAREH